MIDQVNKRSTSNPMLWEWHPPFLGKNEGKDDFQIVDRKAYFSIAQFPALFQTQIREHLSTLEISSKKVVQKTTEDIQRVLGSQGVGLSSLIAIGGSQVSGALGFYSTLWLLNNLPESKSDRFIIPTDVCNQYLESLARDSDKAELLKGLTSP